MVFGVKVLIWVLDEYFEFWVRSKLKKYLNMDVDKV